VARLNRLGIFGGTFDPPHLGHLALAAEACDQLDLAQVLWVLTPNPPHKTDRLISPLERRLGLLRAAIGDNPAFELSRIDIDRPPPHYAADTVELLHGVYPGAQLVYLMGADSLTDLPAWHEPQRFVGSVDEIGVMCRLGETIDLAQLEPQLPGVSAKVRLVDAPMLEISSTDIRERIKNGRTVRYFLPKAVWRKIDTYHLYR
jgi:nicotinate-nucleotide adenylyltransferase